MGVRTDTSFQNNNVLTDLCYLRGSPTFALLVDVNESYLVRRQTLFLHNDHFGIKNGKKNPWRRLKKNVQPLFTESLKDEWRKKERKKDRERERRQREMLGQCEICNDTRALVPVYLLHNKLGSNAKQTVPTQGCRYHTRFPQTKLEIVKI